MEQGLNNIQTVGRRAQRFESVGDPSDDSALGLDLDYMNDDNGIPQKQNNEISAEKGEGSNGGPGDEIQNEVNDKEGESKEKQEEERDLSAESIEAILKDSTDKPAKIGSSQEDGVYGSLQPQIRTDLLETLTGNERLAFLLEKHKVLKSLMREFYVVFDTSLGAMQPEDTERTPPEPQTTTSSSTGQLLRSSGNSAKGKRSLQDRGSSPPGDDRNDDRRKRIQRPPGMVKGREERCFACPFFKYDPRKYSCTSKKRCKYRTCAGPGFESISRLK